ncbi:winged helix-turn-helix domain-containing protein [Micromonospora sp. RTGN7]|uniref:winged helix-turn-helix domain-containing protein n=1 Tax=Micromonospora sp. RTGN7 TaxID=3016526 RepID=UPI0029FED13C|nr:winged helix-turn-helix domain-containing protein [Micromonospora sp. RTGN7]
MPVPMSSRQIADDLTARITAREYKPGTKLPSLRELSDLYSVSVSTIQRALELTRDRGLTVGRAGSGVYVVDELPA